MTGREHAMEIFEAAVAAVQPQQLIPAHIVLREQTLQIFDKQYRIDALPRIYVIGAGKASAAMAQVVEELIGKYITAGLIVTKYHHGLPLKKIRCLEAAHPVPDENCIAATLDMLQLLNNVKDNDIVICLLSGGASALWADLPPGVSLPMLQVLFSLLINCGAQIKEVNAVRKHLSLIKGGQLLRYAPGANWFSLIISDVPGDLLEAIASGPTVADASTFKDVKIILDKYTLTDKVPKDLLHYIQLGISGLVRETVKEGDGILEKVHCRIIGSNRIAVEAAVAKAEMLNYHIPFVDIDLTGDAATIGKELVNTCRKYKGIVPACFLFGGETTVTVTGKGKGGRNQHMALSAFIERYTTADNNPTTPITILCAGTDGTDGPTDAAGAIADEENLSNALACGIDPLVYLADNDAYHFFEQVGGLVKSGPTQTNVMDLVVMLVRS